MSDTKQFLMKDTDFLDLTIKQILEMIAITDEGKVGNGMISDGLVTKVKDIDIVFRLNIDIISLEEMLAQSVGKETIN